jgi:hypothetical protein
MRAYASFFQGRNKVDTEVSVVEELIVALNGADSLGLHSPSEYSPDPPDCVCLDSTNTRVAIEVTEVVCPDAARLNAHGHNVYRNWRPGELRKHVETALTAKDLKTFNGGPYHTIVACLHSDEPTLTLAHVVAELDAHRFGPFGQLTHAYFLLSYDPASKTYPCVKLALGK